MLWEPSFVVVNAFEYPLWQGGLMLSVWKPMNTNALTVSLARELPQVIYDVAVVNIIHIAHKRVSEVMCD